MHSRQGYINALYENPAMKRNLLVTCFFCLLNASCTTTNIDDQTQGETPTKPANDYTLNVESYDHGAHYWFPERKMCNAIRKAPETLEGYHPIYAIETFPSPYEYPLRHGYNFDLKPHENLSQKLSSGHIYGRAHYGYSPRDSFVYKQCLSSPQRALIDDFMNTMRACYGGSFGIYIEKFERGISIEGDNGRNCSALSDELVKVHLQGYKPSFLGSVGGVFGGAEVGSMVKALDRCESAVKGLDMAYDNESDKLVFSCRD